MVQKKNPANKIVSGLKDYINWLLQESQFSEFYELMEIVKTSIEGKGTEAPIIDPESVKQIYNLINSMRPLHGAGFDLFGAVYEKFASTNEKKDFGEYFTPRHYTYVLSKLLLRNESYFNPERKFRILDTACGTGGFLTEAFKILRESYLKTNTLTKPAIDFLKNDCFWGYDVRKENISRTKLNMFLVGDGHTHMIEDNTLLKNFKDEKWDYIITNPPYGAGTIKADSSVISSYRTEVAFLYKIISLLKDGGSACIILPDGILENPSMSTLRNDFLEKCKINAIISLPKFAFAPYTKEKTYAVYFTKKNKLNTDLQKDSIWMYIIDNDGLANSDKRFPTKLRNNGNEFLHDEINGYYDTNASWIDGKLEKRWLSYDDSESNGTEWIDEKGVKKKLRKGEFLDIKIIKDDKFKTLLPEYYLRPYAPKYFTLETFDAKIQEIEFQIKDMITHE